MRNFHRLADSVAFSRLWFVSIAVVEFRIQRVSSIIRACAHPSSTSLQFAFAAKLILFLGIFSWVELRLGIDNATEIGFFAIWALVEGTSLHRMATKFRFEIVFKRLQQLVSKDPMDFCLFESHLLHLSFQDFRLSKLLLDCFTIRYHDFLLASRACKIREVDIESFPLLFE